MNYKKVKKAISIILIIAGAVALITEIATAKKNYYMQSVGVVCLMIGLFMINSGLSSRHDTTNVNNSHIKEEEE
ncbi:hypothetical protein [Aquimarina sp. 2201CG5-10]|uniref:hypothetical protein n=1 Tax=Aquimarina callyspongiae TaxID=3098150 RepID=UPI002AB53337|nr:hypothetical protein [Aquimarina sp. 2201CG5-10]MDY8138975.1 hypothetical protein [Aquimarina sp. 2201CG5-10]